MNLFRNGHAFRLAYRCCPPTGYRLPTVTVDMARPHGGFVPVIGILDTGAFRTALNYPTARRLGIDDPATSPLATDTGRTATNAPVEYYVHRVTVRIAGQAQEPFQFPLQVAFVREVVRNLFGRDWLAHLCVAVDPEAVHFLRD